MIEERKQWVIVRKDLNMPSGKIGAQVAHAAMAALLRGSYKGSNEHGRYLAIPLDTDLEPWLDGRFTKVTLEVHSEQELKDICNKAEAAGLRTATIIDSGLTVFNGQPTFTCAAIGPHRPEDVAGIVGHLKTYR